MDQPLIRKVETVPIPAAAASVAAFLLHEQQLIKAANTSKAKRADLKQFMLFLREHTGNETPDLIEDLSAWGSITFEQVKSYVYHMIINGYAISSVNRHLSTIRTRVKLAAQAGLVTPEIEMQIKNISGYTSTEAKRIDEQREQTRRGAKKQTASRILVPQTHVLKRTGTVDRRLMFCLMLDHGLRVGEIVTLKARDIDHEHIQITRHKTKTLHRHRMTTDTMTALKLHLGPTIIDADCYLFPSSTSSTGHISERTVSRKVRSAGNSLGINNLSCHDCRHSFLNKSLDCGSDLRATMQAGGWSTFEAIVNYVEKNDIANDGVILP